MRAVLEASTGWTVSSTFTAESPWVTAHRHSLDLPAQSWKLHVSAYPWSAPEVLEAVLPVVARHNTACKVVATSGLLAALNGGDAGVGQVGKFITLYPRDVERAVELGDELVSATAGFPGPVIITDRRLAEGAPVYYRYGVFGADMMQTELGEMFSLLVDPAGNAVPDRRDPWDATPSWVSDPFEAAVPPPAPAGRHVSLRLLHHSARTKVELALDVDGLRECVVKRYLGTAEAYSDGATRRMRRESDALRRLEGLDRLPSPLEERPGDSSDPDAILVMSLVPGESLGRFCQRRWAQGSGLPAAELVAIATQISELIGRCHARGVIHGDLKSANVFVDGDLTTRVLDFDGAQYIGEPNQEPVAWTRGYRRATDGAVTSPDDVYAIGALIYLLATGAEPSRAPDEGDLLSRDIRAMNPSVDPAVITTVAACLDKDPSQRPSTDAIIAGLAPTGRARRGAGRTRRPRPPWQTLAHQIGDHLVSQAERSAGGDACWWRSRHLLGKGRVLRDVNQGVAGTLLALAEIALSSGSPAHLRHLSEGAAWLLQSEPAAGPARAGFYIGETGVAVALLRAGVVADDSSLIDAGVRRSRATASMPFRSPDVFNGTAGRAFAHLVAWTYTGSDEDLGHARAGADRLVASADWEDRGETCCWRIPEGFGSLSHEPQLGYAYGAAGIADVLLDIYEATGDDAYLTAARGALRWIAGQEVGLGNWQAAWPAVPGGPPHPPYWCHGAGGIGIAFTHAARLGVHDGSEGVARRAVSAATAAALWSGPSSCHGLAGMLDLALDWPGSPTRRLEDVLIAFAIERDGATEWVTEAPHIVTPDYMVGYPGIAPVLLRLADQGRPRHLSLAGLGAPFQARHESNESIAVDRAGRADV